MMLIIKGQEANDVDPRKPKWRALDTRHWCREEGCVEVTMGGTGRMAWGQRQEVGFNPFRYFTYVTAAILSFP